MFGETVGSGGDRLNSFNVSTGDVDAAVFVNGCVHGLRGCCCRGCGSDDC